MNGSYNISRGFIEDRLARDESQHCRDLDQEVDPGILGVLLAGQAGQGPHGVLINLEDCIDLGVLR